MKTLQELAIGDAVICTCGAKWLAGAVSRVSQTRITVTARDRGYLPRLLFSRQTGREIGFAEDGYILRAPEPGEIDRLRNEDAIREERATLLKKCNPYAIASLPLRELRQVAAFVDAEAARREQEAAA